MYASQLYSLIAAAGCTVAIALARFFILYLGLRLALRGAPERDRLRIYQAFSLSMTQRLHRDTLHTEESGRSRRTREE
jgi:hypothetical protein